MKATLDRSPDVAGRRDRLVSLCRTLPEVEAEPAGAGHIAFKVGKRIFAYYTYDHHGDGRIALWGKAPPGERDQLVQENGSLYFVPPYVGPRGWVALRLDTPRVDWGAVENLVFASYFMTAPDRLRKHARPTGSARPARRRPRRTRRR